jgi:hypothetical protein
MVLQHSLGLKFDTKVSHSTKDRRQKTDDRGQKTENGGQRTEDRGQMLEVGSRTRRRPIGRDYAAAKDAEVGSWNYSIAD